MTNFGINMPQYTFDLWGIPKPAKVDDKHKHPDMCDLCGKAIKDEDYYYIGVDRYRIWAITCNDFKCKKWLEHKQLFQKPYVEKK